MSNLTLCNQINEQLDDFEEKLPPLAANIFRVNRAVYSRTAQEMSRLGELAADSAGAIVNAASVSLRTVTGTAKWATERTTSVAATGARQTVGQVKAQAKIAVDTASDELEDLADEIAPSVKPVPAAGDLETKTKSELYDQAQALDIDGRSSMTKAELVAAIKAS